MKKVVVIDYGTSNLRSVAKALEHVADKNYQVVISNNENAILSADKIVFPGQGAIGQCMTQLQAQNLDQVIIDCIHNKPYLGICLGLQTLMDSSEEDGGTASLGIISGTVKRFPENSFDEKNNLYKIPHMGWNQVKQNQPHDLWHGIEDSSRFYFVHSYYVCPNDMLNMNGISSYIIDFTAAIAKDNIFATQFHPEKSQKCGLKLLENFLNWKI